MKYILIFFLTISCNIFALGKYYGVDKTALIKDIVEDNHKLVLVLRPAGWGKTSVLHELVQFFTPNIRSDGTNNETIELGKRRLIGQNSIGDYGGVIDQYFGRYPTIFLNLRNIKAYNSEEFEKQIERRIHQLFQIHSYLANSPNLNAYEIESYKKYTDLETSLSRRELEQSLRFLEDILNKHFGLPTIILVDEYDSAVKRWYEAKYKDGDLAPKPEEFLGTIHDLIGKMLGNALEHNDSLYKMIVIGVTNVEEMNLFANAHSHIIDSLLEPNFAEHFGFTEAEVDYLFKIYKVPMSNNIKRDLKIWYGGYKMCGTEFFSPPSVMYVVNEYKKRKDIFFGNNRYLSLKSDFSSEKRKKDLDVLINGGSIKIKANMNTSFKDRNSSGDSFYTLLILEGFLTADNIVRNKDGTYSCDVRIPNREYLEVFKRAL